MPRDENGNVYRPERGKIIQLELAESYTELDSAMEDVKLFVPTVDEVAQVLIKNLILKAFYRGQQDGMNVAINRMRTKEVK